MLKIFFQTQFISRDKLDDKERKNVEKYFQKRQKIYYLYILAIIPWIIMLFYLSNVSKSNNSPADYVFFLTISISLSVIGLIYILFGSLTCEMQVFARKFSASSIQYMKGKNAVYVGKTYYYFGWTIVAISVILFIISWWI